jgi:DNA-directed RNA polymerase subunit RPC12/RpoP
VEIMKNEHGKTILLRCEICGKKLNKAEKELYGYECEECVNDVIDKLKRVNDQYLNAKREAEILFNDLKSQKYGDFAYRISLLYKDEFGAGYLAVVLSCFHEIMKKDV